MAEQARSLEINEALEFQNRFMRVQRVLAIVAVLVLLVAVAGVFGTGPLAHATTTGTRGLRVDFGYKLAANPGPVQVLVRFGRTF